MRKFLKLVAVTVAATPLVGVLISLTTVTAAHSATPAEIISAYNKCIDGGGSAAKCTGDLVDVAYGG